MPQLGQIIPNYLHPHNLTVVNDNTVFQDAVAEVETGPRSLFIFGASRGRDNVILDKLSTTALLDEYGTPNMKLYGQSQYNAYNWLLAQGVASCMRVMPEDATYANLIVLAKVKTTAPVGDVAGSVQVRFTFMSDTSASTEDDLVSTMQLAEEVDPDSEGFVTIPLFATRLLGRGVYGNKYRLRLAPSAQSDVETGVRNYRFEVLEFDGTMKLYVPFVGTFDPDALLGVNSLYLADRINALETGSTQVALHVNEEGFAALLDAYKAAVPTTEETMSTFDFFGGRVLNSSVKIPNYTILDPTVDEPLTIMGVDGIPLDGGSDGSLTPVAGDAATLEQTLDTLIGKAFRGEIDPRVKSRGRLPLDALLDAGFSDAVKRDMAALMVKRRDALLELDGGDLVSREDVLAWGEEMFAVGDYVVSKEAQSYKTRDPFTNRTIKVTTSYSKAYRLPAHLNSVGAREPVVGEDYGLLYAAIPGTITPVVDMDDEDFKEELYKLRINYYEQINERVAIRGTQSTAQTVWSDLTEENNVRILLEIKRRLEALNVSKRYKIAEEEDRKRYAQDAQDIIKQYIGDRSIKEGAVEYTSTPYEQERSIIHTNLGVTFPTMMKRSILEIDVNRRV